MSGRVAWIGCGITGLTAAAGLALAVAHGGESTLGVFAAAAEAVMLTSIAVIGAVVASRLPHNPCGWLVCVIPASFSLAILADRVYDSLEQPVRGFALLAPWLVSWIWIPAMLSVAWFPQLFPSGRPLTGRWRALVWTGAAAGVPLFIGTAFAGGRLEDYPEIQNPVGTSGAIGTLVDVLGGIGFALLVVTVLGAIASLVTRFRRSRGVERQQLKWVATAALVFPVAFSMPTPEAAGDDLGFTLLLFALFLIALAVAVAILRYRLYDVDLVINRTLVYGALTALLAGAYLVSVLLLQLVLSPSSDLAIAGSTLAVAALFRPARARIQTAIDRRFFRRRYDAQRTLESFAARLRDEVTLDAVGQDLRDVVTETMQPAHVSLWLRP